MQLLTVFLQCHNPRTSTQTHPCLKIVILEKIFVFAICDIPLKQLSFVSEYRNNSSDYGSEQGAVIV